MVRSKPSNSKKPKRGGVDFKKVKRKIGRKLPPPKNATNTEVKSKAIVLPEQSMLSERTGMAVNKKGLTLRELLQQTSHHNSKIRRAALNGIRDLIVKHPAELKLHKHAIIEKLRERICDFDKVVRENLYTLFKSVIFPSLKEDITGPTVTLLMAYILNAMTHISIEIRLTAFKFFEQIVISYPASFFMHSDKVLDHFMDILRNNQIYLQDKSRLNSILGGLVHCLSLLSEKDNNATNNQNQSITQKRLLHAYRTTSKETAQTIGYSSQMTKLENLIPVLINCFEESMSLFRTTHDNTGQSFEVLLSTFECLNYASKVLVGNRALSCNIWSLVLVHLRKIWDAFPFAPKSSFNDKGDDRFCTLNIKITEVFLELGEGVGPTGILTDKFVKFIEKSLLSKGGKEQKERNLGSILHYIPKLVSQATHDLKEPLLEAFTCAFKECKVESKLILSYLSAIEEMLLPEKSNLVPVIYAYNKLVHYQILWARELPKILLKLDEKHTSHIKVVLKIILRLGQTSVSSSPLSVEYNSMQLPLSEFFNPKNNIDSRGNFVKLSLECQELAVSCLYYFSSLNPDFLQSLTCSCLCEELDPLILFKIMEVVQSVYKAGRMDIFDNLGFLLTLIARFNVYPENFMKEKDSKTSNITTYKSLIGTIFTYLSQMGDGPLILNLMWGPISDEISKVSKIANMYGLLRLIVALDARISKQKDEDINDLANWIFRFVVASSIYLPKRTDPIVQSEDNHNFKLLLSPCIRLFKGCNKLLSPVMSLFTPFILGEHDDHLAIEPSRKVRIAISFLIILYDDKRAGVSVSSCEGLKVILGFIKELLESNKLNLTFDERQELQVEFERLKTRASF